MDSLIRCALTSESGKGDWPNLGRDRKDKERHCAINTVSARTTEGVRVRDGKKINCRKFKAKELQCTSQVFVPLWIHTVQDIRWQTAWYTVVCHPVRGRL